MPVEHPVIKTAFVIGADPFPPRDFIIREGRVMRAQF
jgi:hypothetical protein